MNNDFICGQIVKCIKDSSFILNPENSKFLGKYGYIIKKSPINGRDEYEVVLQGLPYDGPFYFLKDELKAVE